MGFAIFAVLWVQTLVILYAVLGIVGVFLGDVLMMVVDPRITLTGKEEAR